MSDYPCWLLSPQRKLHYIADADTLKLLADALPKDKTAAKLSDLKALVGTHTHTETAALRNHQAILPQ